MSNVFEGTRFCIHTFGCQMNKHDSERVAGMLEGLGSLPVETIEEADIVVFMTCCVREAADTRLYGQVASMKNIPLRDGTPLDKRYIAVGGCIGQRDGDKLLAALPHLDVVFGTHNLGSLPGLLRRAIEQHGRAAEVIEGGAEFSSALPTVREHDWAAWLPITVGCNNFCSYCIVPYVRGRERSRDPERIIDEVRGLVADGFKEITLLGQNVNSYGKDLGTGYDFADLLTDLDKIEGDYLIRFMSSQPKDATYKLFDVMAASRHVAKQLHLPVQSGCDRVLRAMNRPYDVAKYLDLITYARRVMPDLVLTSDVIIGFPGETESEAMETVALVEKVRFDALFTFIFSPRPGTPAAKMEDPVPREEKQRWFDRLCAVQNGISEELHRQYVGQTLRCLVDGESDDARWPLTARTAGGRLVHCTGDRADLGEYRDIKITDSNTWALFGTIE